MRISKRIPDSQPYFRSLEGFVASWRDYLNEIRLLVSLSVIHLDVISAYKHNRVRASVHEPRVAGWHAPHVIQSVVRTSCTRRIGKGGHPNPGETVTACIIILTTHPPCLIFLADSS